MRAAAAVALFAWALPTPAGAQAPPPDYGGVRNVFSSGQAEQLNAIEGAGAFTGTIEPPPSYTNQLPLFTGLLYAAPSLRNPDLGKYFKPAAFTVPQGERESTTTPRPGVTIVRDSYHVPHVYGVTRDDTMFGSGYAQAEDRLFQMDTLRYEARGRLGELIGPAGGTEADAAALKVLDYSEADLTRMLGDLSARWGAEGARVEQDLRAYVDGINAYIAEARRNPNVMPAEYPALGNVPQDWSVNDVVLLATELRGDVLGGGREYDLAQLREAFKRRFGPAPGRRAYEDFRRRNDPEMPTTTKRRFPYGDPVGFDSRAVAVPDLGSYRSRDPVISGGAASTSARSRDLAATFRFPRDLGRSNVLMLTGRRSKSGHPLAVFGPQQGHSAPHHSIMEIDLHGPGIDARGVAFHGTSPYVEIGRGPDFAWSITSGYDDAADAFAEKLCEPDGSKPTLESDHYMYKGTCQPFESREIRYTTKPNVIDQSEARTVVLRTQRSVHGPIQGYATVRAAPVAYAQAVAGRYHEMGDLINLSRLNGQVHDARSFRRAVRHSQGTLNFFYIDDRDISFQTGAIVPRRARGTHPDLPAWGTGQWDWRGFDATTHTFQRLPAIQNPHGSNPSSGYLVNWNGRLAPGWRAGDRILFWGSVFRSDMIQRRARKLLGREQKVGLADLTRIVQFAATTDLRGQEVYPWLRRVIGSTRDAELRALLGVLDRWNRRGSQRRDLNRDNVYDQSAAVALMDAWWEPLVRGIFEPALGKALVDRTAQINPFVHLPSGGNAFRQGWQSHVDKDIRSILGQRVRGRFSRRYCGGTRTRNGPRRECRRVLVATLKRAAAEIRAEQGPNMSAWEVPATCGGSERCDQIEFGMTGAVTLPPIPGQNRPTFQQIVEISGHRPR